MFIEDFIFQSSGSLALLIIFLIIFAESGLFFGFFLPGDSLLFALGLWSSQGNVALSSLVLVGCLAAITGDSFGYWFGRRVGPALFSKPDSLFFHRDNVIKAQKFYEKYGKSTIVLARFIPIVRTFAPILAGVGTMKYHVFLTYNIVGGAGWILSITMLGYFFGSKVPHIERYTEGLMLAIIVGSILLSFRHLVSRPKARQ